MRRVSVVLTVVGSLLTSAYSLQAEDQPRTPLPMQPRRRGSSARTSTGCSRRSSPILSGFANMTDRGCARCNRWAPRHRRSPTSRAR